MADTIPAGFPPNTLHTMRAVCALSLLPDPDQDKLVRGLEALYKAMWTDHADVAKPEVFGPLLVEVLGEEVAGKGEFCFHLLSLSFLSSCSSLIPVDLFSWLLFHLPVHFSGLLWSFLFLGIRQKNSSHHSCGHED